MPTKVTNQVIKKVQPERAQFKFMLAKNPNYFGNIPGSKYKQVMKMSANVYYEEITCAGYNPDTETLEAVFSVKQPAGYMTGLCQNGSFEYLRFYLDLHDGAGFVDQGLVGVNVHNVPQSDDCKGNTIFPLQYAAVLPKKTSLLSDCNHPVLPTLRVILSWEEEPPANSPDWPPPWGNVFDCDIQLKPLPEINIPPVDIGKYLQKASDFPFLTAGELAEIAGVKSSDLLKKPAALSLAEVAQQYGKSVPASRFAFKEINSMIKFPMSEITLAQKKFMDSQKIDYGAIINNIGVIFPVEKTKANVDWEELECVGLDYNHEALVATVKIKQSVGYKEDLCHPGSKEYVAFWIDWGNCSWTYLNTVELPVHDIKIPAGGLHYQVTLPVNFTYNRKPCDNPNIKRVRAVLSWDSPPSSVDPDLLNYYGNRIDTHIQIKPGVPVDPGEAMPIFNIIGGIDIGHVDDTTGLTKPGSSFAENGVTVPTGAPFGGVIVLNGPSFPGYKYRVKVTNLGNGSFYYLKNNLTNLVGYLPVAPWVQYTTVIPDAGGWYDYQLPDKNTLNILARFTPGTEDKLLVELEVQGIAGTFGKTIQMDNTGPVVKLTVNDYGDCTHFHKGVDVTGNYYVYDRFIDRWIFSCVWGGNADGTANTAALPGTSFSIPTLPDAYPCGAVNLWAEDKTIVDSQWWGYEARTSYIICLQ
jgi:hypothetical protein